MSDETLPPDAQEHEEKLRAYLDELLEANRHFNLTAVRNEEEAWSRHIVESASLVQHVGSPKMLLDVGSGGGLPGMVLAICRADVDVTLLEATAKKTRFLQGTAEKLSLSNVHVVTDRAETAGAHQSPHREHFEMVTARAVAPLRTLLEITIPFLQVGGELLAIKGDRAQEEITEAKNAFRLLHAEVIETQSTPAGTLLRIKKTEATSKKYPRRVGEPKHRPL